MYVIFFWLVEKEGLLVALDISEIAITEKASQKKKQQQKDNPTTNFSLFMVRWYC